MRTQPTPNWGRPSCCTSANRRQRPAVTWRGPLLTEHGRVEGSSHRSHEAASSRRRDDPPRIWSKREHQEQSQGIGPTH